MKSVGSLFIFFSTVKILVLPEILFSRKKLLRWYSCVEISGSQFYLQNSSILSAKIQTST